MDPYLEAHWRDIHAGLVIYARDALQGVLPGPLRARVEERVLLETPQGLGDHPLYPDPMPLWERLPVTMVPLRRGDEDFPLALQALVESATAKAATKVRSTTRPNRTRRWRVRT